MNALFNNFLDFFGQRKFHELFLQIRGQLIGVHGQRLERRLLIDHILALVKCLNVLIDAVKISIETLVHLPESHIHLINMNLNDRSVFVTLLVDVLQQFRGVLALLIFVEPGEAFHDGFGIVVLILCQQRLILFDLLHRVDLNEVALKELFLLSLASCNDLRV